MRLRRSWGADGIATVEGGYSLQVADTELDAVAFESQVHEARARLRDGYAERAASHVDEA